jgi:hypothetical protein
MKEKVAIAAAIDPGLYDCLHAYWLEQRAMRSKETWGKADAEKHLAKMREIFGLADDDFGVEIREEVERVAVMFLEDVMAQVVAGSRQRPAADELAGAGLFDFTTKES